MSLKKKITQVYNQNYLKICFALPEKKKQPKTKKSFFLGYKKIIWFYVCTYVFFFLWYLGLLWRIKYFLKALGLQVVALLCFAHVTSHCTVWQDTHQDHVLMKKVQPVCMLFVWSSQGMSNWLCPGLVIYIIEIPSTATECNLGCDDRLLYMLLALRIILCFFLFSSWNLHLQFNGFMFLKQIIKKFVVSDMSQRPVILLSSKV